MKSLLIVDDHLMIGSALRYLLSQLDPDVATTAVGSMAEAMELLNAGNRYDLVLLDYEMPGTDGITGLKMIRDAFPDQTVGMLSGRTDPGLVKSAITAGAVGWLPKSVSEEPMLHALRMMAAGGQFVPTDVLDQLKEIEDGWGRLTPAELKVAELLAEGASDKEIAKQLDAAPKTVENHVRSLLRKADVDNRTKFALAFRDRI